MSEGSNWIERRFSLESSLKTHSVEVWHSVRAAIQDACESFRDRYEIADTSALTDRLENCSRMMVSLFLARGGSRRTTVISFNPKVPAIEWGTEDGDRRVVISADENKAFLVDEEGKPTTPDTISKLILEPILFGADSPYKPTFPSISSIVKT